MARRIGKLVDQVEQRSPQSVEEYRQRIAPADAARSWATADIAEQRILAEAALFADKVSVTEEVVRLRSHLAQLQQDAAAGDAPVGRKLDFLVQEMNREANTIGSKANGLRAGPDRGGDQSRDRKDPGTDPEHRSEGQLHETDQHRLWQYGLRQPAGGHRQPGIGAHQADHPRRQREEHA